MHGGLHRNSTKEIFTWAKEFCYAATFQIIPRINTGGFFDRIEMTLMAISSTAAGKNRCVNQLNRRDK